MEETKWLKPSVKRATIRWQREGAGRNASERRANLEKVDARADPAANPGKAAAVRVAAEGALRQIKKPQFAQIDHNVYVQNPSGRTMPLILWSPAANENCIAAIE